MKALKIGIIGGGKRCAKILDLIEQGRLRHFRAQVAAVADIDPQAPGFVKAQEKGIFTTTNYLDFFHLPDLDLVIELTGNEALLHDLLQQKPPHLRVLDVAMSRLCEDLLVSEWELENRRRQLDFQERYVKQILRMVQDPILVLRPDRTVVDANEALLETVGMSADQVLGRFCHEVSHRNPEPCRGPHHACPLQDALRLKTSAHAIHEHHMGETRTRYYDVLAYPLIDDRDEVALVLEIWRDISSALEKQVEEKTRQIKEDLARLVHEDKMIALGKLVASAVHEINNPLAAIHTFAKVMLRMVKRSSTGMGPEELQEMAKFLDMVAAESKRCGEIASNLLSFSRHQPMVRRMVDINDVLGRIVLLLQHKMELQHIRLHTDYQAQVPHVEGDLNQIQQAVMNLVFNAMEAMPEGGHLWLRTRHDPEQAAVTIEVEDTGCGIPEENLEKIFEPFFSTKSHDKGVGLGLAVVYGIIKEHKGYIDVESQVGRGTCFKLTFPVAGR